MRTDTDAGTSTDTEQWLRWREQRPPIRGVHVDSAAAGRSSRAVLQATADHAALEAQVGAYVAEELAAPALAAGRADLAGLLGVPPDGLAFVESGTVAVRTLLAAWPLRVGDSVAVTPSEWGPNLEAFRSRGLDMVELAVDDHGSLDLERFELLLATSPPAAVNLAQVASHRGLVQPVTEAAALCRAVGVPLWVDASQALGHVDTACGADAVYSTSRKWLTGPRGVGMVGIAEAWWRRLEIRVPAMDPTDVPVVNHLESREAHMAGRVGLSVAVREHLELGPPGVWRRLRHVGRKTREALDGVRGWAVVDPLDAPSAITALRPTAGQDVVQTRARLVHDHGIVTTAGVVARAPREMTEPLLRISPHIDCTADDLARLRAALSEH